MSRVLLFGQGPLPHVRSDRSYPVARRTWQVARALQRAGHELLLIAIRGDESRAAAERVESEGIGAWSVSEHDCHERPEVLDRLMRAFAADCAVGVGARPSAVLVNVVARLPLWIDLETDPMVDAQARSARAGGDFWINESYRRHVPALLRGDRFSTRSKAHRLALIGQLGLVGRLVGKNDAYEFVHVLPEAIDPATLAEFQAIERRLRQPGDPFDLLWSGGFHAWADVDLLFEAVSMVMAETDRLHFAAIGGPSVGEPPGAWERFAQLVGDSPFRARFDLPGWVDRRELPARYERADAGIFVERPGYEAEIGSRARVTDWLAAGLPVVCTDRTEIARDLDYAGLGITAPCGGALALRDAIRGLMDDPEDALSRALRGRRYARERLSSKVALAPLCEWASAPRRAPALEATASLERHPSAVRKSATMVRSHIATRGLPSTVAAAGRFALRRLANGVTRGIDRLSRPAEIERR